MMQSHLIGSSALPPPHSDPLGSGGVLGGPSSSSAPLGPHPLSSVAGVAVSAGLPKDEIRNHFATREGTYRLMTLAEYSRPNRVPLNQAGNTVSCAPVRVSFLSVGAGRCSSVSSSRIAPPALINGSLEGDEDPLRDAENVPDRICFNVGRELYVYLYKGTTSAADLTKPIDKRVYKGTFPTCHHFNQETATPTSCSLLIGFSAGQVQLIDPFQKDYQLSRLYNEERLIEKTAVTCLRWVPGQPQHFLVSHSSGSMYLYYEELQCSPTPPTYQLFKQGDKYAVFTCKAKTTRNPVYRWQIGTGAIQQFAFSPVDNSLLATVGHDGYLRIFNFDTMELLSFMLSYFGGLLCVAWSPDGRLLATGGEDDLLTVYSFAERRVVCRGLGHKSWISQVAFDPFMCSLDNETASTSNEGCQPGVSDDEAGPPPPSASSSRVRLKPRAQSSSVYGGGTNGSTILSTSSHSVGVSYRLGSVGHDTQLCLWDITDDVIKQPLPSQRHRNSTLLSPLSELQISSRGEPSASVSPASQTTPSSTGAGGVGNPPSGSQKESKKKNRIQRRGFTFAAKFGGGNSNNDRRQQQPSSIAGESPEVMSFSPSIGVSPSPGDDSRLLGTRFCPRMHELPLIEPLICKKIAHERLTVLEFRRDCFVTACQEGFICTWARPSKGAPSMVRREAGCGSVGHSPHDSIPHTTTLPHYWSS